MDLQFVDGSELWNNELQQWTEDYCRRQEWRVRPDMDAQDLAQEAYLLFARCVHNYAERGTNYIIKSYRVAIRNFIINCAWRTSYRRKVERARAGVIVGDDGEWSTVAEQSAAKNDGLVDRDIQLLLSDCPVLLRIALLNALDGGGRKYTGDKRETTAAYHARMQRVARQIRRRVRNGKRETLNQYLCRLANVDPSTYNLREPFEALFRSKEDDAGNMHKDYRV